jgi:hypothetical protein
MLESFKKIQASGLLELYVIGEIASKDKVKIELALIFYPELKIDLVQIEKALFLYAQANSIPVPHIIIKDYYFKSLNSLKTFIFDSSKILESYLLLLIKTKEV